MKRGFSSGTNSNGLSFWLLILRVAIACFMLTHGWPKFQHLVAGNMQFGDPIGIGVKASLILTVFAEVICSVLVFVGFVTRYATIPLIINMIVAAFIALQHMEFAKKELPLLYLLIYVTIAILGPGKFSVDAAIGKGGRR